MDFKRIKEWMGQWLLPCVGLLAVIVILLIRFTVRGMELEQAEVEERLAHNAKEHIWKVERELYGIQKSNSAMAVHFGNQGIKATQSRTLLYAQREAMGVYNVALVHLDGSVVSIKEGDTNISDEAYFVEITEKGSGICFVEDDGITGKSAFVIYDPIVQYQQVEGYVLSYYDVNNIKANLINANFGATTNFLIMKTSGEMVSIVGSSASKSYCTSGNYFDYLRRAAKNSSHVDRMRANMQNGATGMCYMNFYGVEEVALFVPILNGEYYYLSVMPGERISALVDEEWHFTEQIIWQILGAFVLFLLAIIGINIWLSVREKEKNRALENKADRDLLTDLYNKKATERRIREHMAKYPNQTCMMFVFDIDNFKKINDTMGHVFGDEVLRTLGVRISTEFRSSDILGRTGGDEFTLFLCNLRDEAAVKAEAERLEHFFDDFRVGSYVKYSATASIGAAVFPRDGKDFESLYKAADIALYKAKERGKNQLAFYGDDK